MCENNLSQNLGFIIQQADSSIYDVNKYINKYVMQPLNFNNIEVDSMT